MDRAKIRKKIILRKSKREQQLFFDLERIIQKIGSADHDYGYIYYSKKKAPKGTKREEIEKEIELPRFKEAIQSMTHVSDKILVMDMIYDMSTQWEKLIDFISVKFIAEVNDPKTLESLVYVLKHERCIRQAVEDMLNGILIDEKWVREAYLLYLISDL